MSRAGGIGFGLVFAAANGEVWPRLGLPRLVFDDQLRRRSFDPADFCDAIGIVLHRLGRVVHQVLIDVIGIEQRHFAKGFQQALGQGLNENLRSVVLAERLELRRRCRSPSRKTRVNRCLKAGKFRMVENGGVDGLRRHPQTQIARWCRHLGRQGAFVRRHAPCPSNSACRTEGKTCQ